MSTFAEQFVRSYARTVVERIVVDTDRETGRLVLSFGGRHAAVELGRIALQEEAFRELAKAIESLLGVES